MDEKRLPAKLGDSAGAETLPEVHHPSRVRHAIFLCLSLGFVATGAAMGLAGGARAAIGWFSVAFFGTGVLVFGANLVPGASCLVLEAEGFTMRSLWRDTFVPWDAVLEFGVTVIASNEMVAWNYRPERPEARTASARSSHALCGFHASLPDTYGLWAADLALRMEEWRAAA